MEGNAVPQPPAHSNCLPRVRTSSIFVPEHVDFLGDIPPASSRVDRFLTWCTWSPWRRSRSSSSRRPISATPRGTVPRVRSRGTPPPSVGAMSKVGAIDDPIWTRPSDDATQEGRPYGKQRLVVIAFLAVLGFGVVYPALAAVLSRRDYGTFAFWKLPNRIDYCGRRYDGGGPQRATPTQNEQPRRNSSPKTARRARTGASCPGLSAGAPSMPTWRR